MDDASRGRVASAARASSRLHLKPNFLRLPSSMPLSSTATTTEHVTVPIAIAPQHQGPCNDVGTLQQFGQQAVPERE